MWEVVFYETEQGDSPAYNFVTSLDIVSRAKVDRQLHHLEEYGITLAVPGMKALGKGLYELRAHGKKEVRIFYCFAMGKRIYLLHAIIKKTQKTPKKELEIARERQSKI